MLDELAMSMAMETLTVLHIIPMMHTGSKVNLDHVTMSFTAVLRAVCLAIRSNQVSLGGRLAMIQISMCKCDTAT